MQQATISRPHWATDLLSFYIQRKIFRRNVPLLASFKLTYNCNLSCSACPFHLRAAEPHSRITWDAAVAALDDLKKRGTRLVTFEGGEPFLWRDGERGLRDLVEYAKKRGFLCVSVTTNGTFPLDVPADVIWVSIDGMQETHDRLRSGSFERIWANLDSAGSSRVLVHCTLNRMNWRELEALAVKVKRHPVVKGLSVQLFYPYGQGESPLALSDDERRAALEQVIRLKRSYPIINSERCLRTMTRNEWRCHDDVLINVDPDGTISQGCYVKGRGSINCRQCGFTPVAEASGALDLRPGSLLAGWRAYLS